MNEKTIQFIGEELLRLMKFNNQLLEENIRLWKDNSKLRESQK
jgi:hypothetical protein